MRLSRDDVVREFRIKRTLGSRVHQYYIGVLEEGPEEAGHPYRTAEHVLPFGFELTLKDWIPIVHAKGQGGSDSERDDPFERPSQLRYDVNCSMCHTTQPMGNLMLAMFKRFAAYSPRKIHFEASLHRRDKPRCGPVRAAGGPVSERKERQTVCQCHHPPSTRTDQARECCNPRHLL